MFEVVSYSFCTKSMNGTVPTAQFLSTWEQGSSCITLEADAIISFTVHIQLHVIARGKNYEISLLWILTEGIFKTFPLSPLLETAHYRSLTAHLWSFNQICWVTRVLFLFKDRCEISCKGYLPHIHLHFIATSSAIITRILNWQREV